MKTFLLRNKCYVKSFLNFLKSFHEAPGLLPVSVECAKFRESRAIVGFMGLVPPCHRAFMGPKLFWRVFLGSKIFSRWYFVGPQFFLWVFHESNIFLWVFHRSNIFLVGISWVQYFFSQVSRGSKILWLSIDFGKKIKRNVLLTNFN